MGPMNCLKELNTRKTKQELQEIADIENLDVSAHIYAFNKIQKQRLNNFLLRISRQR